MQPNYCNTLKKFILVLFTLFFALPAFAHVKWFVDPAMLPAADFQAYSLNDPEVLIWLGIASFIICASVFLDSYMPAFTTPGREKRQAAMTVMRMFTGISLLITAYEGNIIAPHLHTESALGTILVTLQALIGIMFMVMPLLHHACMLLFVLMFGLTIEFGVGCLMEYCNFIGIGLFFFINSTPFHGLRNRLQPYSVDLLRIFTGLGLLTLGVNEKLSGAVLGEAFLAQNDWNFMDKLGLDWFTDQLFVLSAGVMEVVLGIILIIGTTTRINILVVFCFMLSSNLVFLFVGDKTAALMELIGHIPVIGTALVLLVTGYGQSWKVTHIWKKQRALVKPELKDLRLEPYG